MAGVRGFYIHNESWYADPARYDEHEIMIGVYYPVEGGTDGEFCIRWRDLSYHSSLGWPTRKHIAARLDVYGDAWKVLPQFQDLLDGLAKLPSNVTPPEVHALLRSLGITDLTERVRGKRST